MVRAARKKQLRVVNLMSKYTTEVRFICETSAGLLESGGYSKVDDILKKAAPKIFDFDYPIFDESYRLPLEIKILKHYYTREICAETVGLWKLWLNQRMNEIMPIYNDKYAIKAEALKNKAQLYNNVDLKTTRNTDETGTQNTTEDKGRTGKDTYSGTNNQSTVTDATGNRTENSTQSTITTDKNNGGTTVTTTGNSSSMDAYSDTPQGTLTNVENLRYLTNARDINMNESQTETTTGNNEANSTGNVTTSLTVNTKDDSNVKVTGSNDYTLNKTENIDTTTNTNITNTQDYIEHIIGRNGGRDYMEMYKSAFDSLVNIDMQVINELSDLFFGLW